MTEGIDFSYLEAISGGDKGFELSMIRSVTEEIEQKIEGVKNGVLSHNAEAVRLHAHSLKNLFAIIGIEALQTTFRLLETGCEDMSNESMKNQVFFAEKEWQTKKLVLTKIIADGEAELAG